MKAIRITKNDSYELMCAGHRIGFIETSKDFISIHLTGLVDTEVCTPTRTLLKSYDGPITTDSRIPEV